MWEFRRLMDSPSWEWPEEAASWIKRGLDSADANEQLGAAALAGDLVVMDDEMASKLLGIVRSGTTDELRATAAIALGPALEEAYEVGFDEELDAEFDNRVLSESCVQEVQRTLRANHDDDSNAALVRRRCLEASIRAPQDWHHAAVAAAYARNDKGWRLTGLFCMGRIPGFDTQITECLQIGDPDMLVEAVRSAGRGELPEAGPRVLELAASEATDPRVRHAAIETLATLETEGCDELLVALTESEDPLLAELAYESLEERRVFSEPPDSDC